MCHVSHVMCHMSRVTCHVSHVTKNQNTLKKVVELVGQGSVINGATPSSFFSSSVSFLPAVFYPLAWDQLHARPGPVHAENT